MTLATGDPDFSLRDSIVSNPGFSFHYFRGEQMSRFFLVGPFVQNRFVIF
jgi:hypothetical protein